MEGEIEKIVYGSKFTIFSLNGTAKIPILYGGHVLITQASEELVTENNYNLQTEEEITSIRIIINNANSTSYAAYNFTLESGQILKGKDYIDSEGLHIDGNTIAFTSQQEREYEALQNIPLYEGINHITVITTPRAVLKFSYTSNEGAVDQVYVLDKNENLLAIFNKDDDETLINPRIEKKQNAEAVFTFTIETKNSKWKEIKNPENLYLVDGMMFSTNFDGSFKEIITENDEKTVEVTAYERQQLLSRKFVRAWNSETNLENIDTFMVVILSNGDLPLKNDGVEITTRYPKGSSGYVLEGLLYGTGWTVGTCDIFEYENGKVVKDENDNPVYLKFDLETDQMTIYENILKIQELWGGILVFDSVNKIVHHRNETIYCPYNGYEVKYEKNMRSLEKAYNNKIITKLCPLGEGGLNIKSVNRNSVWLENYTYTDSVLEGIENNPEITDPIKLKRWGERKLEMLCRPSIELDVNTVLLHQVEGYELESIDLNHIVEVIGYEEVMQSVLVGIDTIASESTIIGGVTSIQLRVVEFSYSLWDKSDATIKLSNITLDSTDIFRKTINATNSLNAGTVDASRITTLYKGGQSVETTMFNMNTEIGGKVGSDEIVSELNAAIGDGQGTLVISGNHIIIDSDNFKLTEEGNVELIDGKIKIKTYLEEAGGWVDFIEIDNRSLKVGTFEVYPVQTYTMGVLRTNVKGANFEINDQGVARFSDVYSGNKLCLTGDETQYELWSAGSQGYYMTDTQTITLSQNISDQRNGIVLVWSDYSNGQANDYNFNFTFIPRGFLDTGLTNNGIVCQMSSNNFLTVGTKYLYISNSTIVGHASNNQTGTNNGITYANNRFVLRRVIGV